MKLVPLNISTTQTTDEIMNVCHNEFKRTLGNKNTRPNLKGKEIFIPIKWNASKAEIFLHIGSIEPINNIDILPCNNDTVSAVCNSYCVNRSNTIVLSNLEVRVECIYRATRIGWVSEIINLYNSCDPRVKYWEKETKKHDMRIYLRYQEEEIDYVVVFEKKNNNKVTLITGFPVFYISKKNDYEKDYLKYQREK